MNVLQINTADTKGGAAKVAYSLKQGLEKRSHMVSMFVARKYSDEKNIKILNDSRSFSNKVRRKLAFYLANDIDVFSSDHLLKTPEFKTADIVHCHNLHTNYFNLSTLRKISVLKPIVWTFHDMWPITAHCAHAFDGALKENGFFTCPSLDIYPPIAWHNEKYLENKKAKIYANSNFHITTPSRWLADKVKQGVLKNKPLSVINNGIDTNIFKPFPMSDLDRLRSDINLPQNKKIVLVVTKRGQSNPWKGGNHTQEIMNTYKNNPAIYFVDLGGDESKTEANIKTVSYVNSQETLAKYYSAADFLLYPSVADNCPLVVLEAMACGLPVVSFATGGIPELVDHQKTGYIARYKDTGDLANGVHWMLECSPVERIAMREITVAKILSGNTLDNMTKQYTELYQKIINKKAF